MFQKAWKTLQKKIFDNSWLEDFRSGKIMFIRYYIDYQVHFGLDYNK